MGASVVTAEAYLVVAVIVAASVFAASFTANLQILGDSQRQKALQLKTALETDVKIIFAAKADVDKVKVWVKNVGRAHIPQGLIGDASQLFFGPEGAFRLIPHGGAGLPRWEFTLYDNDADGRWDPAETVEVTIYWDDALPAGDYLVRFVTYTGSYADYLFTL